MKVEAKLKYLRMSPRKVRAVADLIRGLKTEEALKQLGQVKRRAAYPLKKLLLSAIANAENNFSLDRKSLKIDELTVDGGSVFKRFMPRARGRATPIRRRTSHVKMVLEGTRLTKKSRPEAEDLRSHKVKSGKEEMPVVRKKDLPLPKKDEEREVKKKIGKEEKPSFVKRIFRRKSI